MVKVGIIGAGAAGIASALEASKLGAQVCLLEANPKLGRKLSATGSGRCNITNLQAKSEKYTCSESAVLKKILMKYSPENLIAFLKEVGIPTYSTPDGWVYPISNSASNVAAILESRLKAQGVKIHLQTLITDIRESSEGFILATADAKRSYQVQHVIAATGSPAYPQLGARNNLYSTFQRLGHTILPVLPALTPIMTDPQPFHKLQGVRLDAGVELLRNGRVMAATVGNIIFTRWGLNGPGVMDLSHLVSQNEGQTLTLRINIIPHYESTLTQMLSSAADSNITIQAVLLAFLPAKAARFILGKSGLPGGQTVQEITQNEKDCLLHTLKNVEVDVKGTRGFKHSQLSSGGIPLAEIHAGSLQSRIKPGLYFAGEVLDVLGPCGGYNLHWAFTSGLLAGRSAAIK
ncbi:MAG TPA: aminoacetone oxidase family FAD-binding enzyme [Anaerolineae bacterium]|nr:aminoacetone oxidase family FAD-binding enzyme [Anaerolineae bacterium]